MAIIRSVTGICIAALMLSGCQSAMYLGAVGAGNVGSAITSKKMRMTFEESQLLPSDGEIVFTTDDKPVDLRGTQKMMIFYKAYSKNKVINHSLYVDITDFPVSETNVLYFRLPAYKGYYADIVRYYGQFTFTYLGDPYEKNPPGLMVEGCKSGHDYGHSSEKLCVEYMNSDNVAVTLHLSAVFPPRPPDNRRIVQ